MSDIPEIRESLPKQMASLNSDQLISQQNFGGSLPPVDTTIPAAFGSTPMISGFDPDFDYEPDFDDPEYTLDVWDEKIAGPAF